VQLVQLATTTEVETVLHLANGWVCGVEDAKLVNAIVAPNSKHIPDVTSQRGFE